MSVVTVTAYAQHLGTLLLELAIELPEQGDLVCSSASEIKDVKGEDYMFLSLVLTQGDPLTSIGEETEVRGRLSYFSRHL